MRSGEQQSGATRLGMLGQMRFNQGQQVGRDRHITGAGIGLRGTYYPLTIGTDDAAAYLDPAVGEVNVLAA